MTNITFKAIGCLVATGLIAGLSGTSEASVTAMAGLAQNPSEDTCFTNSFGTISNQCAGVRQWCVSSFVSAGAHQASVVGLRPNGGTLACHAVAVSSDGRPFSGTANRSLGVVDVDATLNVGSVSVPSGGAMYVCCDLSTRARIDTVNF